MPSRCLDVGCRILRDVQFWGGPGHEWARRSHRLYRDGTVADYGRTRSRVDHVRSGANNCAHTCSRLPGGVRGAVHRDNDCVCLIAKPVAITPLMIVPTRARQRCSVTLSAAAMAEVFRDQSFSRQAPGGPPTHSSPGSTAHQMCKFHSRLCTAVGPEPLILIRGQVCGTIRTVWKGWSRLPVIAE